MKILILSILLCLSTTAIAQTEHIGAAVMYTHTDSKDGNGSDVGITVQGAKKIQATTLKFVGSASFSEDLKLYLHERGKAVRARALVRYPVKQFFVQGGMYAGAIHLGNTSPTSKDGYTKMSVAPMIGGGWETSRPGRFNFVVDYVWMPRTNLWAGDTSFANRIVDGTTTSHEVTLATLIRINDKWAGIANVRWNHNVYVRNPVYYGALGGVPHPSNSFTISFGIARLLGTL